jgi:hypothetical protein
MDEALFGPLLVAAVGGHKGECGAHVRVEETPHVSARLQAYHSKHRRYPTPMPTAEQLKPECAHRPQMHPHATHCPTPPPPPRSSLTTSRALGCCA